MDIEVLSDADGTIVALSARRVIAANAAAGRCAPDHHDVPVVRMMPGPGHTRHMISLAAEHAALPLAEIAQRFRVVHDGAMPRLAPRVRA